MADKVIDRVEYKTKSGSTYLRVFVYDEKTGEFTGTTCERRPKDNKNRLVSCAYLSPRDFEEFKRKISSRELTSVEFKALSDFKRPLFTEKGGYFIRWENLPTGKILFNPSTEVVEPINVQYKTIVKENLQDKVTEGVPLTNPVDRTAGDTYPVEGFGGKPVPNPQQYQVDPLERAINDARDSQIAKKQPPKRISNNGDNKRKPTSDDLTPEEKEVLNFLGQP